jgi:hypothetical protein
MNRSRKPETGTMNKSREAIIAKARAALESALQGRHAAMKARNEKARNENHHAASSGGNSEKAVEASGATPGGSAAAEENCAAVRCGSSQASASWSSTRD